MDYLKAEANVSDSTFIQRPMTDEEIAADELHRAEMAKAEKILAEVEAKAAVAKAALLEKLGITEEEAKLLLA